MVIGTCKYCREPNKPLAESHLVPSAIYDLCDVNGEVVLITAKVITYTGRHLKYRLLCQKCDGSLSTDGEDWTVPLLATIEGKFPLYDLLQKVPPDFAETDLVGYAVSRNPEIQVEKLAHFALGVFWKASVHSWRKNESENLIELGPYSEGIRKFLRHEGPFPQYVALTIGILPPPVKHIAFCQPYRGSASEFHSFMFYVPGIAFALSVGKQIGDAKENCFYSNPLHPVVVSALAGDIRAVMREATKNAYISKRVRELARSQGRQ